ncbi:helicase-associated domain-containing protein [Paenibacillus sinopodophylli]|uniref:helicase-associated domain-containing protein n=1 Tax=Paenibacillus sinopodophylli TaxID=1837342 RepID=UPI00110CB124|nr:helicase-associated domain-containing protein [Paenibacillus sinopodophylli]
MRMKQLLAKLSADRQERYMHMPVWHQASQMGMTWKNAAVSELAIGAAADRLTECGLEVIKQFVLHYAVVPVEYERLIRELRAFTFLSGAECQLGIAELEEAGILFSVKKAWGESLYFMPAHCFIGWSKVLFPYKPEQLSSTDKEKLANGTLRPYCRPFSSQLLSMLAELGRNGLGLTLNGVLPKKIIAKLMRAISIDDFTIEAFKVKGAHGDAYPPSVAFMLQAAVGLGLLSTEDSSLIWNESALRSWLELGQLSRDAQLMDWCLELLLPAEAGSAHAAAVMLSVEAGEWFSIKALNKWLSERELTETGNWCGLLYSMGWIEVVQSGHGNEVELYCKWKRNVPYSSDLIDSQSESSPNVSIQPNGEVIVDPDCPFTVRWELELIAARKSEEQVTVYQLEAAAIARAVELGRTKQSIQRFLQDVSGGEELPSTVGALLDVWTSHAGRTVLAEITLLRCDHQDVAAFIERDMELAPFLLQKLGLTDFIVEQTHVQEIRRLLARAGYPARKVVLRGTEKGNASIDYPMFGHEMRTQLCDEQFGTNAKAENMEKNRAESMNERAPLFLYETYPLHHFTLNDQPLREKLIAGSQLERVPSMWIKQMRSYHHSTRRELIEQALQWQTPIQMRIGQGLRSFVPEKLEYQGDSWAVVGMLRDDPHQTARLTPDMWEEMQLLIPGQESPI